MIYSISANDKRFKSVKFKKGLNIILADRKQESKDKDSRNGLGKTTLINIIHFLLGAELEKNSLPVDKIQDWIFSIELDLLSARIIASRGIENPGIIKVEGDIDKLSIKPEREDKEGFDYYKVELWKKVLGIYFYGLQSSSRDKYVPTFRSLISYSIRRGVDAYTDPFRYFRSQPSWSVQVHNAFLLGLNWIYAAQIQDLKDRKSAIDALESAIKVGIVQSKGELEAKRVNLEKELKSQEQALINFKVHPQYREIQEKANKLTTDIHSLNNEVFVLNKKLQRYKESISQEQPPDNSELEKLYNEVGISFPDNLKKTLAEAQTFHYKIVQNRKNFLAVEIKEISNLISEKVKEIETLTNSRADLMSILSTHGALEEHSALQSKLLEKKGELDFIKSKLNEMKDLTEKKKVIKKEKLELETKLTRDYEESRVTWEKAISTFNDNTNALYDEAGSLIIDISENGYNFNVEISRSSSEGVGKMKIFCFDLMLVETLSQQGKIDILIHDSSIFDGVDSRQRAHALELAQKKSSELNFQYICAFNSDMIPANDFSEDFNVNDYITLTVTDKDPSESLMGFRYNE